MEVFKNLSNGHLLYEVQKDALQRAKGYINLSLILCILEYVEIASMKKWKRLMKEIYDCPRDIPLFDITIQGMEYILAGMGMVELVEVLTKDYWDNPVKDTMRFEKYMGILGVLMIKEEFPMARAQQILLKQMVLRNQIAWKEEEWIDNG